MTRYMTAAFMMASLAVASTPPSFADDVQTQSPPHQQGALAPGGAAGMQTAQFLGGHPLLILVGLGAIAGGVALAVSGHGHHSSSHT